MNTTVRHALNRQRKGTPPAATLADLQTAIRIGSTSDHPGGRLAIDLAWCVECGVEKGHPCVTTTHQSPTVRVHMARRMTACVRLFTAVNG